MRSRRTGLCGYLGGTGGGHRLFEVKFCECAMQGSPTAYPTMIVSLNTKWTYVVTVTSPSWVSRRALGGHRLLEVPLCEYAMRGSPGPYTTLLRSPSTKYISLSTVIVTKQGLTDGAARKSPSRWPIFENKQCKALRHRIPLGSKLQTYTTLDGCVKRGNL